MYYVRLCELRKANDKSADKNIACTASKWPIGAHHTASISSHFDGAHLDWHFFEFIDVFICHKGRIEMKKRKTNETTTKIINRTATVSDNVIICVSAAKVAKWPSTLRQSNEKCFQHSINEQKKKQTAAAAALKQLRLKSP